MFFKDNQTYTEQEIKNLYPNTSFAQPFNPSDLGFEVIFDVPKPECTNLQAILEDGTELDSKGNRVKKFIIKDMFSDTETKTKLEQETEYLAGLEKAKVPSSVTMRQARLALIDANLYTPVDTAISALTGVEGEKAKVEWEYATTVERNSSLIMQLSSALSMTEAEVDNLFIAAQGL